MIHVTCVNVFDAHIAFCCCVPLLHLFSPRVLSFSFNWWWVFISLKKKMRNIFRFNSIKNNKLSKRTQPNWAATFCTIMTVINVRLALTTTHTGHACFVLVRCFVVLCISLYVRAKRVLLCAHASIYLSHICCVQTDRLHIFTAYFNQTARRSRCTLHQSCTHNSHVQNDENRREGNKEIKWCRSRLIRNF